MTTADKLLAWRPDAYQYIAARMTPPVKRQHVRYVALGERTSARVEAAIKRALKYRRFP